MAETIFSRILRGEIPCHKVYEDAHVLAFLDVGPLSVFGACCLAMRTRRTMWITQRSNAVTYRWDVICADGCGLELMVATELAKLLGECVPGGVVLRVRQRRGIWSTSMMREIRGLYADRTGP